MKKLYGHCQGTGTCKRGEYGGSCADCLLMVYQSYNRDTKEYRVKCSACNGKGKVRL